MRQVLIPASGCLSAPRYGYQLRLVRKVHRTWGTAVDTLAVPIYALGAISEKALANSSTERERLTVQMGELKREYELLVPKDYH